MGEWQVYQLKHEAKTDSDLARPPCGDHQPRSKLAKVSSLGARRAAGDRRRGTRTRVPVTRSEANHGPRMQQSGLPDDSGIEEERAGGGAGPAGGGPEQENRAWVRAGDVNPEYWGPGSTH